MSVSQSISQSIKQANNQSINMSSNQSISKSINQPNKQTNNRVNKQLFDATGSSLLIWFSIIWNLQLLRSFIRKGKGKSGFVNLDLIVRKCKIEFYLSKQMHW